MTLNYHQILIDNGWKIKSDEVYVWRVTYAKDDWRLITVKEGYQNINSNSSNRWINNIAPLSLIIRWYDSKSKSSPAVYLNLTTQKITQHSIFLDCVVEVSPCESLKILRFYHLYSSLLEKLELCQSMK